MNRRLKKLIRRTLAVVVLAVLALLVYAKREDIPQLPIGCAFKAKALCAGVFIQGRDPDVDRKSVV
jgi:hypothetical protein